MLTWVKRKWKSQVFSYVRLLAEEGMSLITHPVPKLTISPAVSLESLCPVRGAVLELQL